MKKIYHIASFPIEIVLEVLLLLAETYIRWYDKWSSPISRVDSTNSRDEK